MRKIVSRHVTRANTTEGSRITPSNRPILMIRQASTERYCDPAIILDLIRHLVGYRERRQRYWTLNQVQNDDL